VEGVIDRYFYGYDRGSNRIWRAERQRVLGYTPPNRDRDEGYLYDGLSRLTTAARGTLVAGSPMAAYDGDFNADGLVNVNDYLKLLAGYSNGGDEWSEGDINGDGAVNNNDYVHFNVVYGNQPTRNVVQSWSWSLDSLGNWGGYNVTTSAGTLNQTRTHDAANELLNFSTTGGSNWISPVHDAAGNMTRMPRPGDEGTASEALLAVYDAWNRPVRFYKDSNSSGSLDVGTDALVLTSRYDGMSHRIQKIVAGGTTVTYDYYYNEAGQVLEERKTVGGGATQTYAQYIWDGRYIHSPSCRFRDSDDNGSLDETLYYCNDANFNVTALVNTAGAVVERYQYTPYGSVTVCDSAWAPRAGNTSAYANEILFTGHRIDWETGLFGTLYRYYHPTIGTWVGRDPLGYWSGMAIYGYGGASPVSAVDPSGLAASGAASWYGDIEKIGVSPYYERARFRLLVGDIAAENPGLIVEDNRDPALDLEVASARFATALHAPRGREGMATNTDDAHTIVIRDGECSRQGDEGHRRMAIVFLSNLSEYVFGEQRQEERTRRPGITWYKEWRQNDFVAYILYTCRCAKTQQGVRYAWVLDDKTLAKRLPRIEYCEGRSVKIVPLEGEDPHMSMEAIEGSEEALRKMHEWEIMIAAMISGRLAPDQRGQLNPEAASRVDQLLLIQKIDFARYLPLTTNAGVAQMIIIEQVMQSAAQYPGKWAVTGSMQEVVDDAAQKIEP
jgi:RHS repeat-associated protein